MKLKEAFKKPIDRPIDGVIKANDMDKIHQEIEEYVITQELGGKLDIFIDDYINKSNVNNGVWISGFFGSGKSHLLKILSLVLENHSIDGQKISDSFIDKLEAGIVKENFKKALKNPTKSLLFNIDEKADLQSKKEVDILLSVFMRVLNEAEGYYHRLPYIADFERELDKIGKYQQFQEEYNKIAGRPWLGDRKRAATSNRENFAKAYTKVENMSLDEAMNVLDRCEKNYSLSIEDFAGYVNQYLEKQNDSNFRINFYVDEMGQFISGNTKLMLNLQTIAETLAVKCKGRAWVFVTSQEAIDSIVGDAHEKQSMDFSKIQGRFATRLNLTSANVAEVIQKRLLDKTDNGKQLIHAIYKNQQNNFRTLFEFQDSRRYKGVQGEDHFTSSFPFMPYQYDLFQSCLTALSNHNAFEGKFRSVGERSMLAVFQDVLKKIGNQDIGEIATFDLMFEGIRNALKSEIQRAIIEAEKNLDSKFALKVMKALFLVKFVNEFKASPRDISILLINRFDIDLKQHEKNIKEALNLLESQTYVQRNGIFYEFLTDEEKDVENEIKNTEVESRVVYDLINEIIFSSIVRDSKIRFADNSQDFSFTRKIDDQLFSKEQDLSIHIFTSMHRQYETQQALRMASMNTNDMVVVLPADDKVMTDLRLCKQTEKYCKQAVLDSSKDSLKRIIRDKQEHNFQRKENIKTNIEAMLSNASFYINGNDVDVKSQDPAERIKQGFQELIRTTYPNIRMLKEGYNEQKIKEIVKANLDDMLKSDALSEAEQEIFNKIRLTGSAGRRFSLKTLHEEFSKPPYGWYQFGAFAMVALLQRKEKIELTDENNAYLMDNSLIEHLTNRALFGSTFIEVKKIDDPEKVRKLKDFHKEFFHQNNTGNSGKEAAQELARRLDVEVEHLQGLLSDLGHYPFLEKLREPLHQLKELQGKNNDFYLENLYSFSEALLDAKEDLIDPIKNFMEGERRTIYDEIKAFYQNSKVNLPYLEDDGIQPIEELLENQTPFRGNAVQQAKQAMESVKQLEQKTIKAERKETLQLADSVEHNLTRNEFFVKLNPDQQKTLKDDIDKFKKDISENQYIPVISEKRSKFSEQTYQTLMKLVAESETGAPIEQIVSLKEIRPKMSKSMLSSEEDVNDYVEAIKKEMMNAVKSGKKIVLNEL